MAKTKSEIFAQIGADLPDNTSGAITPEALRGVLTQMADAPIYANPGVKEVEVLRASSVATQTPTAVDTPLNVVFGAAQGSAANPVMINSAGLVTFNQAGNYAIRIKLQCGRTGATGISIILARVLLAGAPAGSISAVKISPTEAIFVIESRVVANPTAGQTFQVQIMRDSAGANFGGLYQQAATVAAWGTAPSALLVISRLEAA
jgi:hypothetical protein